MKKYKAPEPKDRDLSRELTRNLDVTIIRKHELAKRFGMSESTIYRWTRDRKLPPPLVSEAGRIQGWLTETIERWIEENL